jgi:hypothetical protein
MATRVIGRKSDSQRSDDAWLRPAWRGIQLKKNIQLRETESNLQQFMQTPTGLICRSHGTAGANRSGIAMAPGFVTPADA